MNINKYYERLADATAVRRFTWFLITALTMAVLLLSMRIAFTKDRVRTVITPATINKTIWIDDDKVSKEYLVQMSDYIAQLMYNATPASVEARTNLLLSYLDSKDYSVFEKELKMSNNLIKQTNISTTFFPSSYGCDEGTKSCKLSGEFLATQGEKVVQRMQREVLIQFEFSNSGMHVISIKDLAKKDIRNNIDVDPNVSTKIDAKTGEVTQEKVTPDAKTNAEPAKQ